MRSVFGEHMRNAMMWFFVVEATKETASAQPNTHIWCVSQLGQPTKDKGNRRTSLLMTQERLHHFRDRMILAIPLSHVVASGVKSWKGPTDENPASPARMVQEQ